jgi:hypothetical protein
MKRFNRFGCISNGFANRRQKRLLIRQNPKHVRDLIDRLIATGANKPHKRQRVEENKLGDPFVDVSGPVSKVIDSLKQKISSGVSPRNETLTVVLYYLEGGVFTRNVDTVLREKIDALRSSERTRLVQYIVSELRRTVDDPCTEPHAPVRPSDPPPTDDPPQPPRPEVDPKPPVGPKKTTLCKRTCAFSENTPAT